jgi:hypothetical protein
MAEQVLVSSGFFFFLAGAVGIARIGFSTNYLLNYFLFKNILK